MAKIRCGKCTMEFAVAEPSARGPETEHTKCAAPGCGLRYWHAGRDDKIVKVGVDPRDVPYGMEVLA